MKRPLTRRSILAGGLTLAGAGAGAIFAPRVCRADPLQVSQTLHCAGINIAGAEFGALPGRHGYDYFYPTMRDIHYVRSLAFNCVRIPFRWERLQPRLYADFDNNEWQRLQTLVRAATALDMYVVVDPHNYAKRRIEGDNWTTDYQIGSETIPIGCFEDFWGKLAEHFKDEQRIIFGIMNEPFDISPLEWLDVSNRAIAAIRKTGARNFVLVPGTAYSGAHSWISSGNTVMAKINDPIDHFAIEVHQYLDIDSSGTSRIAVSGSCGSDRLREFQQWARIAGVKAFLGEFAGANDATSLRALADICQEMSANPDVWCGWCAWAAGAYWPSDYMFNLSPTATGEPPAQMALLAQHAHPSTLDYWVRPGGVIDIDIQRGRVHGCSAMTDVLNFAAAPTLQSGIKGDLNFNGALLALMQNPPYTLLIETLNFDLPAEECSLLNLDDQLVLSRTADGGVRTLGQATLATNSVALTAWSTKRRIALSVDSKQARIAIAATDCGAVIQNAKMTTGDITSVMASAGEDGGSIVRITGYREFISGHSLDELVA